jgi:hypothetical protein
VKLCRVKAVLVIAGADLDSGTRLDRNSQFPAAEHFKSEDSHLIAAYSAAVLQQRTAAERGVVQLDLG